MRLALAPRRDDAAALEVEGAGGRQAPAGEVGMRGAAARRWRGWFRGGCAREARRGRRLDHAVDLDEGTARTVVRMARRLGERQHRREAGIRAFEDAAP